MALGDCGELYGAATDAAMRNLRLIARLDIKGPNLIKSIQLEGVRVVGDPNVFARKYYEDGVDELLYMDAVASLYGRDTMQEIVRRTADDVFVPITVGGGLRTVEDVRSMLRAGADKVAINTAATQRPELISDIARIFGSQCVVLQIDAKKSGKGGWEAYCDGGREHTGLDAITWAQHGEALGAGEILLTSVDKEGTCRGFDVELVSAIASAVAIPVIASGGMGSFQHLKDVATQGGADAIAIAHLLHYGKTDLPALRSQAKSDGLSVRTI